MQTWEGADRLVQNVEQIDASILTKHLGLCYLTILFMSM